MKFLSSSKKLPGSSAFVRADLDIPLDESGNVIETFRLDALVPTLEFLRDKGIKPVIAGHMGRPEGTYSFELSTERLTPYFDDVLGVGNYVLLENLRFNPGESRKDDSFAAELASEADFYVNESFATCHRDVTSISLLPTLLPSFAGLRLEEELKNLNKVLENPSRPLLGIVGGVKESKKRAIHALANHFDYILVVGALKRNEDDPEKRDVFYPLDYTEDGLDIGPRTIENYVSLISKSSMVIWAGPAGAYDQGHFTGSKKIAEAILRSSAYSIVGGGDTVTCLNQLELLDNFDFVSTGGGALLEFLSGDELPGLEALE